MEIEQAGTYNGGEKLSCPQMATNELHEKLNRRRSMNGEGAPSPREPAAAAFEPAGEHAGSPSLLGVNIKDRCTAFSASSAPVVKDQVLAKIQATRQLEVDALQDARENLSNYQERHNSTPLGSLNSKIQQRAKRAEDLALQEARSIMSRPAASGTSIHDKFVASERVQRDSGVKLAKEARPTVSDCEDEAPSAVLPAMSDLRSRYVASLQPQPCITLQPAPKTSPGRSVSAAVEQANQRKNVESPVARRRAAPVPKGLGADRGLATELDRVSRLSSEVEIGDSGAEDEPEDEAGGEGEDGEDGEESEDLQQDEADSAVMSAGEDVFVECCESPVPEHEADEEMVAAAAAVDEDQGGANAQVQIQQAEAEAEAEGGAAVAGLPAAELEPPAQDEAEDADVDPQAEQAPESGSEAAGGHLHPSDSPSGSHMSGSRTGDSMMATDLATGMPALLVTNLDHGGLEVAEEVNRQAARTLLGSRGEEKENSGEGEGRGRGRGGKRRLAARLSTTVKAAAVKMRRSSAVKGLLASATAAPAPVLLVRPGNGN
jgi:hypothetical protein